MLCCSDKGGLIKMAESSKDCEFWLPPQFLTDDDIFMDNKMKNNSITAVKGCNNSDGGDKGFAPREFLYGFGTFGVASDLNSPVESVVGSTESTESDEEDYLTGLTRKMAHSTLEDCFRKPSSGCYASENTKAWVMSGSPQSTLCAVGTGCGCKQGSSRGSPTGPFQRKSSPPATWDLLYAAAGEVARMRMNEEVFGYNNPNRGLLGGPPKKPSPISVPSKNPPSHDLGFLSNHTISHQQQVQVTQFQQMKQQMMKQQSQAIWGEQLKAAAAAAPPNQQLQQQQQGHQMVVQNRARNAEIVGNRGSRQMGLSASAWPPLQQQPRQNGSGMRALFLGTPGTKRECAGTGVFLPRRGVGYPPEPRQKPACSTALLPARVVQALNMNWEEMVAAAPPPPSSEIQPRFYGSFSSDTDAALRIRSNNNNVLLQQQAHQQKRNIRSQPVLNHEIMLPQEWTY